MKKNKKVFTVPEDKSGTRLDIFLMDELGLSRPEAQKAIKLGLVSINGKFPKKAGEKLKSTHEITVEDLTVTKPAGIDILDEGLRKSIELVEETKDYLVINKPSGLLVHPTDLGEPDTVTAWVFENYPDIKGVGEFENRPGIVHRLDKEASGIMVIAKNQKMFQSLKKQFKNREIDKEYSVLVHGVPDKEQGIIDFEISRGTDGRMAARPKIDKLKIKNVGKEQPGREAVTEFWVEKAFVRFSLLKVKIYTGRTHQIRVHMFSYNHPVVGDRLYVNKKLNLKKDEELGRLFLHARKLAFTSLNGEKMEYKVELPEKLDSFLETLN